MLIRLRALLVLTLFAGGCLAVLAALAAIGSALPPLDPSRLDVTLATAGPVPVLAAWARALAMAATAWMLLSTLFRAAKAAGPDSLPVGVQSGRRRAGVLSPPGVVRRRVEAAMATVLATSTLAVPTAAVAAPGLPTHVPAPITREVQPDHDVTPPTQDEAPPSRDTAPPPAPAAALPTTTHTVVRGEHLWAIAEGVVTATDPGATTADITAYWRRVVDLNVDDLPSGDPDLVHPGDRVVLPDL